MVLVKGGICLQKFSAIIIFIMCKKQARLAFASSPGPIFTKGLSQALGLKLRLLSFVLGLVVFTKNLRTVLGLTKGSTLRLVGSGLKFCKEDLNMAALNFFPLQNLKGL